MEFNPIVTIAERTTPPSWVDPDIDDTLVSQIRELVRLRVEAIRNGRRAVIDSTYDSYGVRQRDGYIAADNHERTSYCDWYLNKIERGLDAEILGIHIIPVSDAFQLPYRYNVTWPTPPDLEIRIRTANAEVDWFVRVEEDRLVVVIPSFADAPWKEPILETRGGKVEFNSSKFSNELAEHLGLELVSWAVAYMG